MESRKVTGINREILVRQCSIETVRLAIEGSRQSRVDHALARDVATMDDLGTGVDVVFIRMSEAVIKLQKILQSRSEMVPVTLD